MAELTIGLCCAVGKIIVESEEEKPVAIPAGAKETTEQQSAGHDETRVCSKRGRNIVPDQ